MKGRPRTVAAASRIATNVVAAVALAAAAPASLAGPKGTDRPIVGTCDTVVTAVGGFGFPAEPLELRIDLVCQFRHLGRTTGVILQTVTPTGPVSPDGVLPAWNSATIVYTAASGDTLFSDYSGPATLNFATGAVAFEGAEVYDGGTGRFAGASGSSWLEGDASLDTNTGFYVTSGTLSY